MASAPRSSGFDAIIGVGPPLLVRPDGLTSATRPSPCTPRWPAPPPAVRCGCLVYCAGYRHPGVLAKAATTIDHLSGGRAEIGLGAGWAAARVRGVRLPVPAARRAARPARRVGRRRARPAPRRAPPRCRGAPRHADRRPQRAPARAGRAADLDRGHRRAPHRPHRRRAAPTAGTCPSSPPDVAGRQAGRARRRTARPSGATPARSASASTSSCATTTPRSAPSSAPGPTRVRPGAVVGTSAGARHRRAGPLRCGRAPTPSTSRCGPRGTPALERAAAAVAALR